MLVSTPATILLAEDEPMVRNLIAIILQGNGYHVLEAIDGQNALEIAQQHNQGEIDLLLTDIVMPKMNGLELFNQFRKEFPETKVILMSGNTEDPTLKDVKYQHNTGFISKPFLPQALTEKIEELLSRNTQTPTKHQKCCPHPTF